MVTNLLEISGTPHFLDNLLGSMQPVLFNILQQKQSSGWIHPMSMITMSMLEDDNSDIGLALVVRGVVVREGGMVSNAELS